jgi:small subunit ribosomal protein S17
MKLRKLKKKLRKWSNKVSDVKKRKTMSGFVVSDKMNKTVTVRIEYNKLHPLYKKYIKKSKKFKAHDEKNECKAGDFIKIASTRPLSKDKFWEVIEIIKRAK